MKSNEIIDKYKLREKAWTYKGFHGLLHTFFPIGEEPLKPLKKFYGDSFQIALFFAKEDYINWYWNEEDMIRLRKSVIKKVNKDPKFLDKILAEWRKLIEVFKERIRECEKADLKKLSDEELLRLYERFYQLYIDECGVSVGLQESFSLHADRFMKPLLEKILKEKGKEKKLNEYFAMLTSPVTESFIVTEFKERLKILKEIQKNKPEEVINNIESFPKINKILENHSKNFFWVENNYAKIKVLTKRHFIEKLVQELNLSMDPDEEIKKIDGRLIKIKEDKKELIKELNLDDEFKNLIKMTEVFAYMQDERKKYVLIANHYQKLFLNEIGRRLNLTEREMNYTVIPELRNMLLNKDIDKDELKLRYRHCLCIQTLEGYEIFEGAVADEIYEEIFKPKVKEFEDIKGICASQGKVKGVVRIVQKVHDLINVNEGDIIVTSMTRPEMVTAMEKAAAIVTDEGGITSHAAVVSREFGIPCIIGTKIATKFFKDGDKVEVDADKGIVRKLK